MRAFGTFDTGPPAAGPGDRPRSSSLSRPPRFPSAAGQGLKAPDHRVPQRFLSPGVGLHWHWPRPSTSSLESLDYDLQERSWTRYCSVRRLWRSYTGYFFHHPVRDGVLYGGLVLMLLCYSAICLTAPNGPIPLISIPHCDQTFPKGHGAFSNPSTQRTPCTGLPHPQLGYLNLEQCDNGVRLLAAVLCAFFLCNERAKHDHPVIFRLVPLVSVGCCLFTICGMFALDASSSKSDGARVSAACPSGIAFMGGGMMYKGGKKAWHVHGGITAATVWVAASVGIACGGSLYINAALTTALGVLVPRALKRRYEESNNDDDR